jgi:hypothetical protein
VRRFIRPGDTGCASGMDDSENALALLGALDTQEIVFSKWEENFPQLKTIVRQHDLMQMLLQMVSVLFYKERDVRI